MKCKKYVQDTICLIIWLVVPVFKYLFLVSLNLMVWQIVVFNSNTTDDRFHNTHKQQVKKNKDQRGNQIEVAVFSEV